MRLLQWGLQNKNAIFCVFGLQPVKTHRPAKQPPENHNRRLFSRNRRKAMREDEPSRKVEKTADLWYNNLFGIALFVRINPGELKSGDMK